MEFQSKEIFRWYLSTVEIIKLEKPFYDFGGNFESGIYLSGLSCRVRSSISKR